MTVESPGDLLLSELIVGLPIRWDFQNYFYHGVYSKFPNGTLDQIRPLKSRRADNNL